MRPQLFTNVKIFDGTGAESFLGEALVDGNTIKAVARWLEWHHAVSADER